MLSYIKWSNIHVIGIPDGEEREWGRKKNIWRNTGQKFADTRH